MEFRAIITYFQEMNYLAHLFLSGQNKLLLTGNFIADFLKNRDLEHLNTGIVDGVYLHRAIDAYTDQHRSFKNGTKRLHKLHGKYAGVINDIFYDHLLYLNWATYTKEPYDDFESRIYGLLKGQVEMIPAKSALRVRSLIQHKWLRQYTSLEGITDVFYRMRYRVPDSANLDQATQSLVDNMDEFNREFNTFFPDCFQYVNYKLKEINLRNAR